MSIDNLFCNVSEFGSLFVLYSARSGVISYWLGVWYSHAIWVELTNSRWIRQTEKNIEIKSTKKWDREKEKEEEKENDNSKNVKMAYYIHRRYKFCLRLWFFFSSVRNHSQPNDSLNSSLFFSYYYNLSSSLTKHARNHRHRNERKKTNNR